MATRSRVQSVKDDWNPMRDDYDNSNYDPQYGNNSSDTVHLDHCRLYITNIPPTLSDDGLRTAFSKYGKMSECFVNKDPQKRYGLVAFETAGEAKHAMMNLNRTEPLKLNINVAHKAKPKPNQPRSTGRSLNSEQPYRQRNVERQQEQPQPTVDRSYTKKSEDSVSINAMARRPDLDPIDGDDPESSTADDDLLLDSSDPEILLRLEELRLEQVRLRQEEIVSKQRIILLKQNEKRAHEKQVWGIPFPGDSFGLQRANRMDIVPSTLATSNRSIMQGGKVITVPNSDRPKDNSHEDVASITGAGDSNVRHGCSSMFKIDWVQDTCSTSPSTCILCIGDEKRTQDKCKKYTATRTSNSIETVGFASDTCKSTHNTIAELITKKLDVNKDKKIKESTTSSKSNIHSDYEEVDKTRRLIQHRNSDYMDIVEDSLKVIVALDGYPKFKMQLRQMELFQRSLSAIIDMQLKAGLMKQSPTFVDYYLNRGAIVCICKDADTRDWVVRVTSGLQEQMSNSLVLLSTKVKRVCLAVLKIPQTCWPNNAQDAFRLLQYFNPSIKTQMWKIYTQKICDNVECTSFIIDQVSGEILRGPSFKNVIDYSQMEFELTGYTEIYCENLTFEEDISSVTSRVKLLNDLRSQESTRKNQSDVSLRKAKDAEAEQETAENSEDVTLSVRSEAFESKKNTSEKFDMPEKQKDVQYVKKNKEVILWSDETNQHSCGSHHHEVDNHNCNTFSESQYVPSTSGIVLDNGLAPTFDFLTPKYSYAADEVQSSTISEVAMSNSNIESNYNLIDKSGFVNVDSNRGIAYNRRTNYLYVENELKVALTLEGYPQDKLDGTHIKRLKHLFKDYLHKDIKNQRFTNMIIPKFLDIYLSNGAVIYICDSLETKDYLTEVLPKFVNSMGLKLEFKDIKNLVRYTRVVMRVPQEFSHVESVDILAQLTKTYPGLQPECWKRYSDVAGKQKRQFGVDPKSLEVIRRSDFDPIYEGEKISFRVIDRQKRDVSFEEHQVLQNKDDYRKKLRDFVMNQMYFPIDSKIIKMPLTKIRTNHYSHLIPDDLKLYLSPANYPEERIEESVFVVVKNAFENEVETALEKEELTENTLPEFHDIYLLDGVIFIICVNIESRLWIEKILPAVNTSLHTNLIATEFRGAVGIVRMYANTDKNVEEIIETLQHFNPRLRTKYWRKISTSKVNCKLEVVLQIDKLSAEIILSPDFYSRIGSTDVQFKLGNLKSLIRPKSSLQELLKKHASKKTECVNKNSKIKKNVESLSTKLEVKKQSQEISPELEPFELNKVSQQGVINKNIDIHKEVFDRVQTDTKLEADIKETTFNSNSFADKRGGIVTVESGQESPKSLTNSLDSNMHQNCSKMIIKIPPSVLPEYKDDVNIIFDLLEDKNPGLNTELWEIYAEHEYFTKGKVAILVDKQSASIIKGHNFDSTIAGEKLRFFY